MPRSGVKPSGGKGACHKHDVDENSKPISNGDDRARTITGSEEDETDGVMELAPMDESYPASGSPWPNTSTEKQPLLSDNNGSTSPAGTATLTTPDTVVVKSNPAAVSSTLSHLKKPRSPWRISFMAFIVSLAGLGLLYLMADSFLTRQLDCKGCRMSYMWPSYIKLDGFDTEHTRFASKYSLYLYREEYKDDPNQLNGIPVLFIPGNAGSYRQVRALAAESANYFHEVVQHDGEALASGTRRLDFFAADFEEDFTAFHGQTLIDQAEFMNEAIRYILSLYSDQRRAARDPGQPDPSSVVIVGHSMGGIVARTMLIMPNYLSKSVNTIVTMSAPHAQVPMTFDKDMVKLYHKLSSHWISSYSQPDASNNPLSEITLISIAGGGLDTIVPSDYASIEALVPSTHGFTVFTSTIPTVWTSTDHLSILWCDQLRKVIARALYDIVDVKQASQTKPYPERMRAFRKRFLTGMENDAERMLPSRDPTTLLTFHSNSDPIWTWDDRLVLQDLGAKGPGRAHMMPIPEQGAVHGGRFILLTDQRLDEAGQTGTLEVLLCKKLSDDEPEPVLSFSLNLAPNSSDADVASRRFVCKNAASDVIMVPASRQDVQHPFWRDGEGEVRPFSYLQYDTKDLSGYQYLAVVDKRSESTGFVIAQSRVAASRTVRDISLLSLLTDGLDVKLRADRDMISEVRIPSMKSSLLAYNLEVRQNGCDESSQIFAPMVRQYLTDPYESKFYVNVKKAAINMHGVSPYLLEPSKGFSAHDGLTLQIWADPDCASTIDIHLEIDWRGSLGKLWMRYRTIFAVFPLMAVTMILWEQFRIYDATGSFISFSESLERFTTSSFPFIVLLLVIWDFIFGYAERQCQSTQQGDNLAWSCMAQLGQTQFFMGTKDFGLPLIPLFGLMSLGVCMALNYAILLLTGIFSFITRIGRRSPDLDTSKPTSAFSLSPARILLWVALIVLVSTVAPSQSIYALLCLVQLVTVVRAASRAGLDPASRNIYNYAHSILILMLWLLPVHLPILVVFIRNLVIGWPTHFSVLRNVLSTLPFTLLVELMAKGYMPARLRGALGGVTSYGLLAVAQVIALVGVSRGYLLHYLACVLAAWLALWSHATEDQWFLGGRSQSTAVPRKVKLAVAKTGQVKAASVNKPTDKVKKPRLEKDAKK